MKIAASIMTAVFVLSVVVQINDPDPLPWMLAYALPAVLSLAAALDRLPFVAAAVAAATYMAGSLFWLPTVFGMSTTAFTSIGMQSQHDEEVREGLGLMIAAVWLVVLAWRTAPGRSE